MIDTVTEEAAAIIETLSKRVCETPDQASVVTVTCAARWPDESDGKDKWCIVCKAEAWTVDWWRDHSEEEVSNGWSFVPGGIECALCERIVSNAELSKMRQEFPPDRTLWDANNTLICECRR